MACFRNIIVQKCYRSILLFDKTEILFFELFCPSYENPASRQSLLRMTYQGINSPLESNTGVVHNAQSRAIEYFALYDPMRP